MTFQVMLGAPRMSPGQREQVKLKASARALVVGEAAGYQISADLPKGASLSVQGPAVQVHSIWRRVFS